MYTWQEAREKYAALLKKRPGVWSQRDVVATTFDMHREHLSPNALKLLDVLSVTFPDRVPFELLDDVLGMETRELAMELADVCLVDTATETGVSIHRVTQLAVRGGLDEAGREGGRETLELNVARSCNEVGIRFMNDARYSDAETLLVHALGTCQRVDGETDHTATSIGNLAMLYTKQGRYKEAEAMYVEKLAMRRKTLPEDHPDIANSLGSLALLYMNQGRYDEAEPMYVKALAMSRKTLPEDHPNVQTVRRSLADCRSRMASPGTETERVERHAQKKKLKKELARQKEAAATPTRQRSKSEDDRATEAAERAMAELLEEEGGTCGGGGKKKKGGGRGGKGKKKGKKKRR